MQANKAKTDRCRLNKKNQPTGHLKDITWANLKTPQKPIEEPSEDQKSIQ